jgi:hypothetical protein
MTTLMSTLTQTSLDEAMSKFRLETENSIEILRKELKLEVQSMEDKIANAIITAIQTTPPMENMETESLESQSMQSSYQETAVTTQSLADKVNLLVNIVQLLTERVSELSEKQETQQIKRNRPLATPPKFRLQQHPTPEIALHSAVLRQRFCAPRQTRSAQQHRLLMGLRQKEPMRVSNVQQKILISYWHFHLHRHFQSNINTYVTH